MGGEKGVSCAAPTCKNYRKTSPALSFFRFPSEKKRCLKWITHSLRKDLEALYFEVENRYFSTNYVLCAAHFTECCFMNKNRNKLVHDAIPSLFTITADSYYLMHGSSLTTASLKKLKNVHIQDEATNEAMQQSRSLDAFIERKLQQLEDEDGSSINICIPHQHLSQSENSTNMNIEPVAAPSPPPPTCSKNIKPPPKISSAVYYLCCSKRCLSTSTSTKLFPFPTSKQHSKWWLEQCGRSDLIPLLEKHGSVPTNFMLCEKHFRRNQFTRNIYGSTVLLKNAMPTIFKSLRRAQKASVKPVTQINLSGTGNCSDVGDKGSHKSVADKSICCYKLCSTDKTSTLYRFPQEYSRCMVWLHNCGYENLPSELCSSSEPRCSGYKLCAQHFQDSAFSTINDKTKLLNYSVPTIFSHGPLKYPCQHKSLPLQHRKCSHLECIELIEAGIYECEDPRVQVPPVVELHGQSTPDLPPPKDPVDEAAANITSGVDDQRYIICDEQEVTQESEDSADEDLDSCTESSRVTFEPMVFTDPKLTTADKVDVMGEEIDRLRNESSLLSHHLSRERQRRFTQKRAMHSLVSAKQEPITQDQAIRYCKYRLRKSTYEFFLCQQLHRKCPPWNFDSVQIPTIANRCGLGVRETLYEIFKMPTLRTISRYRSIIKSDPTSVPDDNLLKNDLEKKYHRKLTRRTRISSQAPRSISAIIGDYIEKKSVNGAAAIAMQANVAVNITDPNVINHNNPSYHHKKYNSPQKWKYLEFDEL